MPRQNIKGMKIDIIYIDGKSGKMKVVNDNGEEMRTTRQQRSVLANYKSPGYEEEIKTMYSNPNILTEEFRVVVDDKYVYGKYVK